ncbi:biotin--[acetyl-CoA-carboxylase] ligase [Pandoraea vervacti]|uniref:biotin--[biotin carboxyl-carrier protein] ligase n=1 Tax=Pandoraea vervacti TaxID=656178 RepID=A0ABN4U705_9BURK|nr:biotin--[acetyl-CoA-carboxylase] ligase [Pandoraea vervacti]APD11114.1 biotin--[acetyl-CoA-carboxylase] ligase [Pandoraea vervacti]
MNNAASSTPDTPGAVTPSALPESQSSGGPMSSMAAPARELDGERIRSRLVTSCRSWQVEVVDATGSTNLDLLARLREDVSCAPIVRAAMHQTAGRGQRGRVWQSLPGDSLTFSLAYVMPGGPAELAGLSLATGVAVVEGLSDLPLSAPQALGLKWPNDVLLRGGKLAGILIETVPAGPGRIGVVIGIGVNLRHAGDVATRIDSAAAGASASASSGLGAPLATPAASAPSVDRARAATETLPTTPTIPATPPAALESVLAEPDMSSVLIALVQRLATMLERFSAQRFAAFREDWEAMHAYGGSSIRVIEQGRDVLHGVALGVDSHGCLRVATDEGERTIASGEVSVRLLDPSSAAGASGAGGVRE